MLTFAAVLLMAGAASLLDLEHFEALPPVEAAGLALEGLDHGLLTHVEPDDQRGLAPGVSVFSAFEQPVAVPGGCRRTVWTIRFSKRHDSPGPALLSSRHAAQGVGLAKAGACDGAAFVHLNPGVTEVEAFGLLARIEEIASGVASVAFECRTEVNDPVCDSPETIRAALRSETPFAISPANGTLELWLSKSRGGIVTAARLDPARPGTLVVEKRIPAPF